MEIYLDGDQVLFDVSMNVAVINSEALHSEVLAEEKTHAAGWNKTSLQILPAGSVIN